MDDAAVLAPEPGEELVVTTDTLVEGVHFLGCDPLADVAAKLLAVNLSDLAAKAAEPWGWFFTPAWSARVDADGRTAFAASLAAEQARHGLVLFGGDTVRTPGPLTLGATLVGRAPRGRTVPRDGARPGDGLWVSGRIGDAGLGLEALTGALGDVSDADRAVFVSRYRRPEPRLPLRHALREHAAAAADVSDGLLADLGRIAAASGCRVEVDLQQVPLSPATARWLDRRPDRAAGLVRLATAGDDYEVVCAVRPGEEAGFAAAASRAEVAVRRIGRATPGAGVQALYEGRPLRVDRPGWTHR